MKRIFSVIFMSLGLSASAQAQDIQVHIERLKTGVSYHWPDGSGCLPLPGGSSASFEAVSDFGEPFVFHASVVTEEHPTDENRAVMRVSANFGGEPERKRFEIRLGSRRAGSVTYLSPALLEKFRVRAYGVCDDVY
jgi:hypothetical protein